MKRVGVNLWRGPRPASYSQFTELVEAGIKFVINLESGLWEKTHNDYYEEIQRSGLHEMMIFIWIRCSNFLPPSRWQVDNVMKTLRIFEKKPIYIHCKSGVDRTGFMIACYRMRHCGWNYSSAVREMRAEGRHWWFFWWEPFLKLRN